VPRPVHNCTATHNTTSLGDVAIISCVEGWGGGLTQTYTITVTQVEATGRRASSSADVDSRGSSSSSSSALDPQQKQHQQQQHQHQQHQQHQQQQYQHQQESQEEFQGRVVSSEDVNSIRGHFEDSQTGGVGVGGGLVEGHRVPEFPVGVGVGGGFPEGPVVDGERGVPGFQIHHHNEENTHHKGAFHGIFGSIPASLLHHKWTQAWKGIQDGYSGHKSPR
ncbi:hypothetical protein Pmani_036132, partial [Petrolisthes manimaculis]